MHLSSPLPKKKARIEIIPLIDIMFFLLASFMMVSLSQTHMKGIKVNLPANTIVPPDPNKKDTVSIRVMEGDAVFFDNVLVPHDEVMPHLFKLQQENPDVKVSLSASMLALHGDVIEVLDMVRRADIKKIGYQIRAAH
jgi:biopolymer transport protein ExbD